MAYQIRHLKLGGILDQAIAITKDHFGVLFGIMLLLYIPATLIVGFIQLAVQPPPPSIGSPPEAFSAYNRELLRTMPLTMGLGLLAGVVVMPLTNAAVVDAVARLYLGRPTSAVASLKHGLSRLLPLVWTTILYTLAVMGGTILLIIPGILFALWFILSTHVVVIEGMSGRAALSRSKQLVRPNMGTLIALSLIIGVINFGIGMVAGLIPQPHVQLVVQEFVTAALTIFGTAAFVVYYFSCRCGVENFDLLYLAESIGVEGPQDGESAKDESL